MYNKLIKFAIIAAILSAFILYPLLTKADHSWYGSYGAYHWARTTSQFTLTVGDNMTSAWKPYLATASSDWNSPGLVGATTTPVLTALVTGTAGRNCSMRAGTTQICNGKYGKNGWLGLASINVAADGVHITQGTAKMNDTYFATSTYNNPNEKLHVVCQETAHTFGLGHQSTDGSSQNSCMDYYSNTGVNATSTVSTHPNAHDFEQLNIIYEHLDTTTTTASNTSNAKKYTGVDITGDPKSWGDLSSQTSNGRGSEYSRRNSDGSFTVTHVYWTDEAAKHCPACDHRYSADD